MDKIRIDNYHREAFIPEQIHPLDSRDSLRHCQYLFIVRTLFSLSIFPLSRPISARSQDTVKAFLK